MDPQPGTSSQQQDCLSPCKKRPRVAFSTTEKLMIRNVYKYVLEKKSALLPKYENLNKSECVAKAADMLGISKTGLYNVLKETDENEFKSPEKRGPKQNFKNKFDEFTFSAIRSKEHQFFYVNEAPTISKVLKVVNADPELPNFSWRTMRKILKHLNFEYTTKTRKSGLIDRQDIISWRQRYLQKIQQYRREGRYIYYQDETWINEGHTLKKAWIDGNIQSARQAFFDGLTAGIKAPSGKGKRLIIGHISGEEGFVEDSLLMFEAKNKSDDYHKEMDAKCFEEWFKKVLPKLKPNSVVAMDNAPYHSRKIDTIPKMYWPKIKIQDWLRTKNIPYEENMVKGVLLDLVQMHKGNLSDKYAVDEMAADYGITVLRLPPYHCELNPIELVWAQVKGYVARNNKSFKMNEVKKLFEDGLKLVTAERWQGCIGHIKKEENKMCHLDPSMDEVSDKIIITLTESGTDSSNSNQLDYSDT